MDVAALLQIAQLVRIVVGGEQLVLRTDDRSSFCGPMTAIANGGDMRR